MKNARKKDSPVKLPNLSPSKNQGKKTRNTKLNNLNIEESPEKENIPNKTLPNFRPQTSMPRKSNLFKNSTQATENNTNNKTAQNFRAQTAKNRNFRNSFLNPPKLYSPAKKEKYAYKGKLLPPIPKTLLERLVLLRKIFTSFRFLDFVDHAPPKNLNDIETVAKYLYEYKNDYVELAHYISIFYYVCTRMTYDIKGVNKDQKDYELIFKNGLCNNIQFCKIFEYMCKANNLKFKHIKGYCKLIDRPNFKRGTDVNQINHSWVGIYIQGEWYFCDPFFASGGFDRNEELKDKNFNPYFFITDPQYLIETHKPIEDDWQFLPKTITAKQFTNKRIVNLGQFYKNVYEYEIELLTHKYPVIHCNMFLIIKLKLQNMLIQCTLYNSTFKTKISEVKFNFDDKKSIYSLEPNFPNNGEYWLSITFHPYGSNDPEYKPLIHYKIIVDDSQEKYLEMIKQKKILNEKKEKFLEEMKQKRPKSVRLPSMGTIIDRDEAYGKKKSKICLDNHCAHLIEPKGGSSSVKIGVETKFKIRIDDDSIGVCILDDHDFIYLKKKDKNIWEGNVVIQHEHFTICSLKPNNVLTEVYRMNAHYATSKLLRMHNFRKEREKDKDKDNDNNLEK